MRTIEDLPEVLAAHREWVESGGKTGQRANLWRADLWRANLRGARLGGADLGGADLRGADLRGADLGGANLWHANLGGANLWHANLRGANLGRANLGGANLWHANLGRANLGGASGVAWVGPVGSEGRQVVAVDHGDKVMVQAGCWLGTVDELRERVAPGGDHGWGADTEARHRAEYGAAITFLVAVIEGRREDAAQKEKVG